MKTGEEYEYVCSLTVNGEVLTGTDSILATPLTPLEAIGIPFDGCVSGTALSTASIKVDFDFRAIAEGVRVYRNGIETYATNDKNATSFVDTGLQEGVTYEYTCGAMVEGVIVMGSQKLPVTTLVANAPVFSGVTSTALPTVDSVTVNWGASSGVPVAYFKVWALNKGTIDFDGQTPDAHTLTKTVGNQSATIAGIGEGLTYTFGARACNASDQCDDNTAILSKTTTETSAPPTTVGATSVTWQY